MAVVMFSVIRRKSLTNDEFYHIPAGCYALYNRDLSLNPENPPLMKFISALPFVFDPPTLGNPDNGLDANPIVRGHHAFTQFWIDNDARFDSIAFRARLPMIALTLVLGWLMFVVTRKSFGSSAALFALLLFVCEPTLLAHGHIVQNDVLSALTYLMFFSGLQRYGTRPSPRTAIWLGICVGVAVCTKYSLLSVLGILLVAFLLIQWRRIKSQVQLRNSLLDGILVLAIAVLVVNILFLFVGGTLNTQDAEWLQLHRSIPVRFLVTSFPWASKILPAPFLVGIATLISHNVEGASSSLLGMYGNGGWIYYLPITFGLKTNLPSLMGSLAGLGWAIWTTGRKRDRRFLMPLAAIGVYSAVAMFNRIDIGVRHFLPVFPFLFMLAGAFVSLTRIWTTGWRIVFVGVLSFVMILELSYVFPDYLPYMNQLKGNRPAWQLLSDSNVEWGEDSGALARYLTERGETRVRTAILGGWLTLRHVKIDTVDPFDTLSHSETKYIAIGASYLNGSTVPRNIRTGDGRTLTETECINFFDKYRRIEPVAVFGQSIYLFQYSDDEVR